MSTPTRKTSLNDFKTAAELILADARIPLEDDAQIIALSGHLTAMIERHASLEEFARLALALGTIGAFAARCEISANTNSLEPRRTPCVDYLLALSELTDDDMEDQ